MVTIAPREVVSNLTSQGRGFRNTGETRGQDPVVVDIERPYTPWDAESTRIHPVEGAAPTLYGSSMGGQKTPYVALGPDEMKKVVCIPINTMAATRPESSEQNRQTFGVGKDGDPLFTLQAEHSHAVAWHNHQQDGSIRMQEETSPTVSQYWGTGGNNIPFVGVRRLTPFECERLQGFPEDWTKVGKISPTARYRMMGNAVAVPVARWIGERIVKAEENK